MTCAETRSRTEPDVVLRVGGVAAGEINQLRGRVKAGTLFQGVAPRFRGPRREPGFARELLGVR